MNFNPLKEIHLSEAVTAAKTCVQNSPKLLVCIILDLLFFVIYGLLSAPIFAKLTDYVIITGAVVSQAIKTAGRTYTNNKSILEILLAPQILPFFFKFLLLLLLLGAIVYILYCIFQGTVWKLSSDLAGYGLEWQEYTKAFVKTNILWFAIFIIYYFASLFFQIRNTLATKVDPSYAPSQIWSVLSAILVITLLYFAILSYISGGIKIGVKAGLSGWRHFAPSILFIMIVFLAIDYIMLYAGLWILELAYLFGIVLFLPALTIAKVYIFRIARKLAEDGILPQY